MDEFLQQLASGNLYAVLATVGTALLTGEGGIIVWLLAKFFKFKSYTARDVSKDTIKGMTSINAKMVEEVATKICDVIVKNLTTLTNNDKTIAESILLAAIGDKEALIRNISKVEGIDQDLIVKVDQQVIEQKQAEENKKQEVENALAQLEQEKVAEEKVETL